MPLLAADHLYLSPYTTLMLYLPHLIIIALV